MESQYIWEPPTFDTSRQPPLVHEAHLPPDPHFPENFARSAKWCAQKREIPFSGYFFLLTPLPHGLATDHWHEQKRCPDGSLALAHCENRSLQYLDMWVILFTEQVCGWVSKADWGTHTRAQVRRT